MSLNKQDVLNAQDDDFAVVDAWGGQIKLKAMSMADQIAYEKLRNGDDDVLICSMLVFCCVNDDGTKMFTQDDIPMLQAKKASVVCKVFKACVDLNSVNQESVEEQAKN